MSKYMVAFFYTAAFAFGYVVGSQGVIVHGIVERQAAPEEWIDLYEDCTLAKPLEMNGGDSIIVKRFPMKAKVSKLLFCGEGNK